MTLSTLTTESILRSFEEGEGETTTMQVLEQTLESLAGIELYERQEAQQVTQLFSHPQAVGERTLLYRYPLLYLGRSVSVVAFRDDRRGLHKPASLAYFNDTSGEYQPVTIKKLLRFMQKKRGPVNQRRLQDLAIRANEARMRVAVAQPSQPAPDIK